MLLFFYYKNMLQVEIPHVTSWFVPQKYSVKMHPLQATHHRTSQTSTQNYLCRFLFFLFLWLPWWLLDDVEEAAFWGFTPCKCEPSSSSVSSWFGSFSWFWKSGELSLSVPLPGSPDIFHTQGVTDTKRMFGHSSSYNYIPQSTSTQNKRKNVEQASKIALKFNHTN